MVTAMATTSMQVDSRLRDELAQIAEDDFGGVPLGEALRRLVVAHRVAKIVIRYEQLRADPEQWADYTGELDEWDITTGDRAHYRPAPGTG